MHLAGVPDVELEHPEFMLKLQQMLPLPSSFKLYFLSSSGQFFSALVIFLLLFGFPVAFGAGVVLFGGGALGAAGGAFCCIVGSGKRNIVMRGSVVSFKKLLFNAGTSATGFKLCNCCCANTVHSS